MSDKHDATELAGFFFGRRSQSHSELKDMVEDLLRPRRHTSDLLKMFLMSAHSFGCIHSYKNPDRKSFCDGCPLLPLEGACDKQKNMKDVPSTGALGNVKGMKEGEG